MRRGEIFSCCNHDSSVRNYDSVVTAWVAVGGDHVGPYEEALLSLMSNLELK